MVDTQLFWYKIRDWLSKMADGVNNYVYTDESKKTVDIINLFLLGWILFGLVVYILGNIIATQLKKRKARKFGGPASITPEEQLCDEESVVPVKSSLSTEAGLSKSADSNETLSSKPLVIPQCSGDDTEVVEWINEVFSWLYNQRVVSPVLDPWLSALNARTRLASDKHGIFVDFQSVVPVNEPPVITEAFESVQSSNEINVSCHIELLRLVFDVLVTQVKEKETNIYKLKLKLNRLTGWLNVKCDPEKLTSVSRFSESPQVELEIEPLLENSIPPEDYQVLHNVICEIALDAFSSSLVQHDFASYPECPEYKKVQKETSLDSGDLSHKKQKERLLVKIVKATNLCTSQGAVTKPYCVIEMDEPQQRFETTPVEDAACPFWDESFVFVLNSTSAELLFEIYDKNQPENENFLGLCIVSVDELVQNPSQRQIIPLQARPLEKDNVSGTLTAEFLFMDREIPTPEVTQLGQPQAKSNGIGKVVETNSRVTAGGTIITTTTIKRTTEGTDEKVSELKTQKILNGDALSHSRQHFLKQMIADSNEFELLNFENNDECKKLTNGITSAKNEDNVNRGKETSQNSNVSTNNERQCIENHCVKEQAQEVSSVSNGPLLVATNHISAEQQPKEQDVSDPTHEDIKKLDTEASNDACKPDAEATENGKLRPSGNNISNERSDGLNHQDNEFYSSSSTIVDQTQNDAEEITETALKELEKPGKPGSTNKSMLIIHSVQRELIQPNMKVKLDKSGKWQEVVEPGNAGSESLEASPVTHASLDTESTHTESIPPSPSHMRNGVDRSRPKDKKSIIGNLRKKLSFRKPRSRSMEAQERLNASPVPGAGNNRSVSSDRMKVTSGTRDSSSLRSGHKHLAVAGSSRSSFSEASGLSTASSRTYINENSTLVIEINENGIIKRYLIPTSMIHRSKWKKKGIKLHLYNDHVFVAKHLSGTTICQVCKKYLTRRPGKQGYECRDCNLQCHKSCHVKVPDYCPNSSVTAMEVEYINDPRLTKPKAV